MKRRTVWLGVAVVVAIAVLGAGVGAVLLVLKFGDGARTASGGKRYLEVELRGEIPDEPASDLDAFFSRPRPSLPGIIEGLERARDDSDITAVVVKVGLLPGTGWGKVQELRTAILRVREKKPVIGFIEDAGNREYYLASACSKVYCARRRCWP